MSWDAWNTSKGINWMRSSWAEKRSKMSSYYHLLSTGKSVCFWLLGNWDLFKQLPSWTYIESKTISGPANKALFIPFWGIGLGVSHKFFYSSLILFLPRALPSERTWSTHGNSPYFPSSSSLVIYSTNHSKAKQIIWSSSLTTMRWYLTK